MSEYVGSMFCGADISLLFYSRCLVSIVFCCVLGVMVDFRSGGPIFGFGILDTPDTLQMCRVVFPQGVGQMIFHVVES